MKKAVLFLMFLLTGQIYAQVINYVSPIAQTTISDASQILPNGIITNPAYNYLAPYTGIAQKGCYLIRPAEMQAAGFTAGDELTSLSWTLTQGQMSQTTGILKIQLSNTSSTSFWMFTTGMEYFNLPITIPDQPGPVEFNFSDVFTYTGQGVFVSFSFTPDNYSNWTSPLQTAVNTNLSGGFIAMYELGGNELGQSVTETHSKRPVTVFGKYNCKKTDFILTDHTDTTATIAWQGAGIYEIEYGLYPYDQGTGGTILPQIISTIENNNYTFTDLLPGKSYTVFMRKICSPTDFSRWSTNYIGTSISETVTTLPYTENFNTAFKFCTGWSDAVGTTLGWRLHATQDNSGGGQLGARDLLSGANNKTVYSRPLQLISGTNYTVSFDYNNWWVGDFITDSENPGDLNIFLTSSLSPENTTILSSINEISNIQNLQKVIQFTVPNSGIYYLGFNAIFTQNPSQDPNVSGNISLNLLNIDNFKLEQTLAVNENQKIPFSLYPNPTTSVLNFSETIKEITIYDLTGRKIQSYTEHRDNIDVSKLSSGNYFIDGKNEAGEGINMKFIKL